MLRCCWIIDCSAGFTGVTFIGARVCRTCQKTCEGKTCAVKRVGPSDPHYDVKAARYQVPGRGLGVSQSRLRPICCLSSLGVKKC